MSDQPIKTLGDGVITTTPAAGSTTDVNLAEVLGTATNVNGGNRDAGTQTTTLADDDPAVVDLDTIAGDTTSIDTKTPALGAAATAASVPVNIANDQDVPVQGDIAHNAVDSGNPVKIGGHARATERAAVAEGDRVEASFNLVSQLALAGYDWASELLKTNEQHPIPNFYLNSAVDVDTTGVAISTVYYPDSDGTPMDGYSDLSFSGKLIAAAAGTLTLSVEMTNDEDTALGDWVPVYGDDDQNNIRANSWVIANGTILLALSFNNANYRYFRVKLVVAGSATNTVIIKGRQKAVS